MSPPNWAVINNPVVTYAEDTAIWSSLASDFNSRLPLRQLPWQNPLRSGRATAPGMQRIIPTLDIQMRPFSPDLLPRLAPGGLHQNSVFMHIFFVGCEDIEYYKNNVRRQLQEWINAVSSKKGQEWLVVHLTGGDSRGRAGLFNIGAASTVLDKIRSDFNLKKDRSMQFRITNNEIKDAEFWNELLDRIKEGLVSAITQQAAQLEDDTRRFEQQRLMPGWNYCQYFILKQARELIGSSGTLGLHSDLQETLAFTYELVRFFDEALLHYDELEATFFQTLVEQGAPWFHKFGGVEPGDDCSDVLNSDRKPYRSMIIQNTITIFDFREYLFSRQCRLIFLLGSPADVCQRTKMFVVSLSKMLREYSVSLAPHFRESWSYSLCMRIVRECDAVFRMLSMPTSAMQVYEALRAELLQIARIQLDRLGTAKKICSNPLYLEGDGTAPETPAAENGRTISNPELVQALSSPETFGILYQASIHVTNLAVRGFEACARPRSALALQSDLAFWHFSQEDYEKAAEIWERVAFRHSESGWHHIETVIVECLARCYRELRRCLCEHLDACRTLVESCLYLVSHPKLMDAQKAEQLVDELNGAAIAMAEPISRHMSDLFGVSIASVINRAGDDDEIVIELNIRSVLVKDFNMTRVLLTLTAGDGKEMICECHNVVLHTGKNLARVSCKKSTIPGNYSPSTVTMESGNLHFYYDLHPFDRKKGVRINETAASLKMTASLPRTIVQGESASTIAFEILTRSNSVKSGVLSISTLTNIAFAHQSAVRCTVSSAGGDVVSTKDVSFGGGKMQLPDAGPNERISFALPFSLAQDTRNTDHKLKLLLSCATDDGRKRLHSSILRVSLVPTFAIDSSMIHEHDGSLIQIGMRCKEGAPMRVLAATLAATGEPDVKPIETIGQQIAFPGTPISLLFQLGAAASHDVETYTPTCSLTLTVSYVPVNDEIEAFVQARLEAVLAKQGLSRFTGFFFNFLARTLLPQIDAFESSAFGALDFGKFDAAALEPLLSDEEPATRGKLVAAAAALWEELAGVSLDTVTAESKLAPLKLVFTATHAVPRVIAHTCIRVESLSDRTVGSAIPCTILVTPLTWILPAKQDQLEVELELDINFAVFAIAGKKRGIRDKPAELRVLLCPLQAGQILLPRVQATVLGLPADAVSVQNVSTGAQISVLPRRQSAKIFVSETPDALKAVLPGRIVMV
ncbi:hypothetical protein HK105_206702 [Polyrhizophydium stewartii]|uniref:Trafficking protein particle complex subunit 10 n=1 Tax=Polyrhizophydium stewartii TaxID=2732419 RepID=A0ABR4N2N9_9FUNG